MKMGFWGACFFICLTLASPGQDVKRNSVFLDVGVLYAGLRDAQYSPMLYSDFQGAYSLGYQYNGEINKHSAEFSFVNGSLYASTRSEVSRQVFSLTYGYHHYITSFFNNRIRLFGGGLWNSVGNLRTYNFNPSITATKKAEALPEFLSSVNLSFTGEYNLPDGNVYLQLNFPVISYIFRGRYLAFALDRLESLENFEDPTFSEVMRAGYIETFNNYYQVDGLISYDKRLSSYVNLAFGYSFSFYKIKVPLTTSALENGIRCKLSFLF